MESDPGSPETLRGPLEPPREGSWVVLVVFQGACARHVLPDHGAVKIGRAEECQIRVDDPRVSRVHAILHVGDPVEVEDLGSANGTSVRGTAIVSGGRVSVGAGAVIDVGDALLLLQRTQLGSSSLVLRHHGSFELRLAEECERGRAGLSSSFAVARMSLPARVPGAVVRALLAETLRASDVIAQYAAREYELLLSDTSASAASRTIDRLREGLADAGHAARLACALYPKDGSSGDALLEVACARLRGSEPDSTAALPVLVDASMQNLYRLLAQVAKGSINVLLWGETGVGKEVIAEAVHDSSPRRAGPFVRVNCAALTESLFESELFGHEKGAFTGADREREGLLSSASGGTVFLDEIGELTPAGQAKLLRVLERKEVTRVGSTRPQAIDVRFVSATNRRLQSETAAGRFREDLYYRLAGVTIDVPPLRERSSEIEPLADRFAEQVCAELGRRDVPQLSPEALELLLRYPWPGNIRELKNMIERAVLLCTGSAIEPAHLPAEKLSVAWPMSKDEETRPAAGDDTRARILEALERCAGNQKKAAEALGISRRTLSSWLDRYGIARPRKRAE